MTTALAELAELQLFTPEQAAVIMSGDNPGAVSGYWYREQIRDGRFDYTPVGRRIMLTREQIAQNIAACSKKATTGARRRKTAA